MVFYTEGRTNVDAVSEAKFETIIETVIRVINGEVINERRETVILVAAIRFGLV